MEFGFCGPGLSLRVHRKRMSSVRYGSPLVSWRVGGAGGKNGEEVWLPLAFASRFLPPENRTPTLPISPHDLWPGWN